MDPKISRWLSGDPAVGEYVPSAPVNDEARKRNGSLPGMGGVFNYVNLHVYHYAGNNPVKYIDPDGKETVYSADFYQRLDMRIRVIRVKDKIAKIDFFKLEERLTYTTGMGLDAYGPCYMRALMAVAETFIGRNLELDELNTLLITLITGNNPAVEINNNYNVQRGPEVIIEALRILDPKSNFRVSIAKPNDGDYYAQVRKNATGSLLQVSNPSNQHWQEGDRNDSFRWDGAHGLDNSKYQKIDEIRYVSIERLLY
jgi:hypothetical protein